MIGKYVKALVDQSWVAGTVLRESEDMVELRERGTGAEFEVHKDDIVENWRDCYCISFIDATLSGWGCSRDKENRVLIVCDSYSESREVRRQLEGKMGFKRFTTRKGLGAFDKKHYYLSLKTKQNCPSAFWWEDESDLEVHED